MAAALLILMALVASVSPADDETTDPIHVADCERGPVTIGSGPPNWRARSILAGPVAVLRNPLGRMSETASGQLTAKMPIFVAGHEPVAVSVPPRSRHRVFLYYGRMRDREGRPTTIFGRARGVAEIRFEPCADRPRTVWPGGIRVRGRKPVRLLVLPDRGDEPIPLRLGRPRAHRAGQDR